MKILAVALFVALITFFVYLPALNNDFVNWDDPDYVYENPNIHTLDLKSVQWMFSSFHMQNWHPLTWLSHAVDYALWKLDPIGHHLTSVVLHALNTFLVVILVSLFLQRRKIDLSNGETDNRKFRNIIAPALTGLFFGLHPIHVESVAWISERKDVLFAFFFLASIIFYLNYVSSGLRKRRASHYYVLSLLFFLFSLMSKPMAVTLPAVLLIADVYPLDRLNFSSSRRSLMKVLLEKLPFFALSLASVIVTILAQRKEIGSFDIPLAERLLTAVRSLSFYLLKIIWPTNLVPLYPYPAGASLLSFHSIAALITVAATTFFCIWLWKREKVFLIVWAFFVLTLSPSLGIIKVGLQSAADRYTYIPSIGPFLLIGLGAAWLWEKTSGARKRIDFRRHTIIACSVIILGLFSVLTIRQIGFWRDSATLWNRELVFYDIPLAYNSLGNAHLENNKYQQAAEDYTKAIELDPLFAKAYNNRGLAYSRLGNHQMAIEDFTVSIGLKKKDARIYFNRANAYKAMGNYYKAIEDYTESIRLNPRKAEVYNNRGTSYMQLTEFQKAIKDFTRAVVLNPLFDRAFLNRAIAYERLGNLPQAVSDYQAAARLGNIPVRAYLKSKGLTW